MCYNNKINSVFLDPNSSCSVAHLGCSVQLRWCTCAQAHLTVSSFIFQPQMPLQATGKVTLLPQSGSESKLQLPAEQSTALNSNNSSSPHETYQHLRPSAKHCISNSSLNWKATERGNFPAGIREQELYWRCTLETIKKGCFSSESWC